LTLWSARGSFWRGFISRPQRIQCKYPLRSSIDQCPSRATWLLETYVVTNTSMFCSAIAEVLAVEKCGDFRAAICSASNPPLSPQPLPAGRIRKFDIANNNIGALGFLWRPGAEI